MCHAPVVPHLLERDDVGEGKGRKKETLISACAIEKSRAISNETRDLTSMLQRKTETSFIVLKLNSAGELLYTDVKFETPKYLAGGIGYTPAYSLFHFPDAVTSNDVTQVE